MIREYDKVRLKTNEIAHVVEIYDESNFVAEIFRKAGGVETTHITLSDIKSRFIEYEEPIARPA